MYKNHSRKKIVETSISSGPSKQHKDKPLNLFRFRLRPTYMYQEFCVAFVNTSKMVGALGAKKLFVSRKI